MGIIDSSGCVTASAAMYDGVVDVWVAHGVPTAVLAAPMTVWRSQTDAMLHRSPACCRLHADAVTVAVDPVATLVDAFCPHCWEASHEWHPGGFPRRVARELGLALMSDHVGYRR